MADGISYINLMHYFDSINDSIMEEMKMTKAEILKKEILRQYRSVRQFALEMTSPTAPWLRLWSAESKEWLMAR